MWKISLNGIAESGIKHQKSINEINQIFKDVISLRLIN
jgi:hypothetical protein